jgi:hypothetical protein
MKDMIPRINADEYCRKLEPQDKPLYIHDSQVKGLVFRIMPAGSKSWILRYHFKEGKEWKQRKTGLGPFRQGRYTLQTQKTRLSLHGLEMPFR